MSYETIRINELAKELNISNKDLLDKLAKIQIVGKTHSSTLTPEQVKKLKDFIAGGEKIAKPSKPKAFIVKKSKEVEKVEVKEEPKKEAEKVQEKPKSSEKAEESTRPRVEVVKRPKTVGIEIVRKAKPSTENRQIMPQRGADGRKNPKFQDKNKKPFNSKSDGSEKPAKPSGERQSEDNRRKQPIQRHIISQEIYETKGPSRKRPDNSKRKDKEFNKKEEQERISLEKAAAQKHKKRSHKEEETKEITSIVVTHAMTISELSEKINHTPAEIVKFLMMNGVMATVNQLIDVDVIKKICAEYNLEVLEEDLDAYIEEEMEKPIMIYYQIVSL